MIRAEGGSWTLSKDWRRVLNESLELCLRFPRNIVMPPDAVEVSDTLNLSRLQRATKCSIIKTGRQDGE